MNYHFKDAEEYGKEMSKKHTVSGQRKTKNTFPHKHKINDQ